MHYGKIIYYDVANGPGYRTVLFVSGCTHHCKNCFNPDTWDFRYGQLFTEETADKIMNSLNNSFVDGLTILGGEPMEPSNQKELVLLIAKIKDRFPDKTIWVYSGYTWEELNDPESRCHTPDTQTILHSIDVLVDGEYIDHLRDPGLQFKGSSNQRLIDTQKTCADHAIHLWPNGTTNACS